MDTNIKRIGIHCLNDYDPYSPVISNFLTNLTDRKLQTDEAEILNLIESAFYADSKLRFGPKPQLEERVYVRSILSAYIAEERPIPILIPWGSTKTDFNSGIDIAEYMAIKQVIDLKNRVLELYKPGIEVVFRIEDTSGYLLFENEGDLKTINSSIGSYSADIKRLISIMDKDNMLTGLKESDMKYTESFENESNSLVPFFQNYIEESDELISAKATEGGLKGLISFGNLLDKGWSGIIPEAQRNYYYSTYNKLYGVNKERNQKRLSLYMAQSLTRRLLLMTGKKEDWNHGFIQVTFVPPIPGLPKGFSSNYIYYRTIPENFTRLHMAPWRSKGYLAISDNGTLSIKPKLASWSENKEYNKTSLIITSDSDSLEIQSDYILL